MRQIKFRGKDSNTGEWVYGSLVLPIGGTPRIYVQDVKTEGVAAFFAYDVEESTVGQFTGLLDKNGNKIYEGDIVVRHYIEGDVTYICKYEEEYACFAFVTNIEYGDYNYFQKMDSPKLQIIGNIHDNPEILKNEER